MEHVKCSDKCFADHGALSVIPPPRKKRRKGAAAAAAAGGNVVDGARCGGAKHTNAIWSW